MLLISCGEESSKIINELQKAREEDERKHKSYLANAGLDNNEGRFAWTVANNAGSHLEQFVYAGENPNGFKATRVSKKEVKLTEKEFYGLLYDSIVDGMYCAQRDALIENDDDFSEKAKNWLQGEIQQRLTTGQEFNLLEKVAVKKDQNSFIYLRLDRKPDPY